MAQGVAEYRLANGARRWRAKLYHRGRFYKWSGFHTKTEAHAFYHDRKRDVRLGISLDATSDAIRVAETVFATHQERDGSRKSAKTTRVYAEFWTAYCGRHPLTWLTPARVDLARERLREGNRSGATINRYVAWLHRVCREEVRAGRLPSNPCTELGKLPERQAPEHEYSPEQEAVLLQELGDDADYLSLAVLTGLRQSEQFRLRWEYLDFTRGVGRVPDSKAGGTQYFVISTAAAKIFERLKDRAGDSPWVFPSRHYPGQPINPKSWYNWTFKPAAVRAGITISRANGLTWHTLRHTFASRLQDAGGDVRDIKEAGRWRSWKAMDRYLKRKQDRVRNLLERI